MCVLEGDPTAISTADVADHDPASDRVAAQETGDLGSRARLRIVKCAAALPFIEGDPPAVGVRTAVATAPHQPSKTEADIGGDVGVHSQQLAQGFRPPYGSSYSSACPCCEYMLWGLILRRHRKMRGEVLSLLEK